MADHQTVKFKPPEIAFAPGQIWRCRGGGLWKIVRKNDRGEWVAHGQTAPEAHCYWRYQDDGRPTDVAADYWGALDLIELVEQAP